MKQRSDQDQWNKEQIEIHLKSAVDTLTPDILRSWICLFRRKMRKQ